MTPLPILPLHGRVQNYAWGATGTLARLLDRPAAGTTEAEYWLGAHPAAPSNAELGERRVPLDQLIASSPAESLGRARADETLPFLLKVLAIGQPLSLQVHPTKEQAEAGFAREEAAGIPIDAAHRSYRDRNHKPEILLALEPTVAMTGVRSPEEARTALTKLDALPSWLAELANYANPADGDRARWAQGVAAAFRSLVALPVEAGAELQRDLLAALRPDSGDDAALLHRLADAFPGDPTVVSALLLNQVVLQPGEALFSDAGTPHAYVTGAGVELMASSDNVLRAGLTAKHIDADELVAVADWHPSAPRAVAPERGVGGIESVYRSPAREFLLSELNLDAATSPARVSLETRDGPEILLLLGEGAHCQLSWGDRQQRLRCGQAAFVPASVAGYELWGSGRLYRARVP